MGLLDDSPADVARRKQLRKMRIIATGLLVLAAIIYMLTWRSVRSGWLGFVNAGSEAAMVGAIADWFAVTAIFRHPLGIPIPHTALVKRRKNDLGRSLQHFFTSNFLTESVIRERIASVHVGDKLAAWLSEPEHRAAVLTHLVRGGKLALTRVKDDDVEAVILENIVPRLEREELSPVLGAFLGGVVADEAHQGFIDLLFAEVHNWMLRHPDVVRAVVNERAPSWTPRWMDKRIGDWAYHQALEWTAAVRDEPQHPARIALNGLLAKLATDMQHDARIRARAEHFKDRVLGSRNLASTLVALWGSVQGSLSNAMDDPASSLWRRGDGWLREIGLALAADDAARESVDRRAQDVAAFIVRTYGAELSSVISTTVERWDADEASDRIELFVGKDLQYIRINGTVVGALAGLIIHTVTQLLT